MSSGQAKMVLGVLENVCVDKDDTLRHSALFTLRVLIRYGHEQLEATCPKVLTSEPVSGPASVEWVTDP